MHACVCVCVVYDTSKETVNIIRMTTSREREGACNWGEAYRKLRTGSCAQAAHCTTLGGAIHINAVALSFEENPFLYLSSGYTGINIL